MPRGMELHFVNSISKPVVRAQCRRILVRLKSPTDRFFAAGQPSKLFQMRLRPSGAFPLQRFEQRAI